MAGFVKQRKKIPITMRKSALNKIPQLIPVDIPFPLPGIHLEKPRNQIVAGGAVDAEGVRLRLGALERAFGWSNLGTALSSSAVGLGTYITDAGIIEVLALSEENLYKYVTDWTQIPQNPAGDLSGTPYDLFWMTQIASDLLFSQGVDPVMRYSGGANFAELNENCPPAKSGIGHQGRLLLGYTTEGGFAYPYRVRWNVVDDIDDWVGASSGYIDLDDTSDYVTCISVLGNYPVIFKEKSIILANRTGLISPVYEFAGRVDLNGTYAAHSVVNLGDRLSYVGVDDIYVFDLNKSTPIGDPVKSRFFDEINPEFKHLCVSYLDNVLDEVHFCTPTGANDYNDTEWIWNRRDNTWSRRRREVKCIGAFFEGASSTWDSYTTTTWNELLQRWKSGSLQASAKNLIFGNRAGVIAKEDPSTRSAAGTAFESFYEFGDAEVDSSKFAGVSYAELHYRDVGTPCAMTFSLSNDGGKSWINKTINLSAGTGSRKILTTRFFLSIQGRDVSFRLYNNSATDHFEIVGLRLWMISVGK